MPQPDKPSVTIDARMAMGNDHTIPLQSTSGKGAFVVRPQDHAVESLEKHGGAPYYPRAHTEFGDVVSFITGLKNADPEGKSPVFWTKGGDIDAILDNDTWRKHRVGFSLKPTRPWQLWSGGDGQWQGHGSLIEFFEDRQADFVDPAPARMLELIRSVKIATSGRVVSAKNIDNGSIVMEFEQQNGPIAGTQFPSDFKIGVKLYEGTPAYELVGRLRYRHADGKLSLSYRLTNREAVEESVIKDVVATIDEGVENQLYRVHEIPAPVQPL